MVYFEPWIYRTVNAGPLIEVRYNEVLLYYGE